MAARNICRAAVVVICFVVLSIGGQLHSESARAATLGPGTIVVGVTASTGTTQFDTRLVAVDPVTGAQTVVSSDTVGTGPSMGAGGIGYISQESDGSLLTTVQISSSQGEPEKSQVFRVDPSTGNRTLIADIPASNSSHVYAARQVGNTIFLTTTGGGLETVDPSTGVITPFPISGAGIIPSFNGMTSMGRQIYVASYESIYKIDSVTGAATIVSSDSVGSGPTISAYDVTLDPHGNLYVASANGGTSGIYDVDLNTGNRTVISATTVPPATPDVGAGPGLTAVTIGASASGTIYAMNVATGPLLSIDPTTGDRTVLSQFKIPGERILFTDGVVVISNVPEPATFILAGLGGLVLVAMRRRR